ncbi:multiple epidermal growth factor-like domains protein 11 [Saccostrea cucullata]|uniref:multiple epidermal growth factor-like domains protein 11 n=1 Tax=Saccostrea cuccullata TaxID=36930 RepID=UPI002ED39CD2
MCNCSQRDCNYKHGCRMLSKDCDLGYTGPSCEIPCRYPAYGYFCQEFCNCEEKCCNPSTGCEVGSPTFEPPSKSTTKKSTNTILSTTTNCYTGFVGHYCNILCRYPSYGHLCQKSCNCEQKLCDFSTGCKAVSSTIEQLSPSQTEKSTLRVLSSNSGIFTQMHLFFSCRK